MRLLPGGDYSLDLRRGPLDESGRFRIENLLPGGSFRLNLKSQQYGWKMLAEKLTVEPGETIDFGTVDITSDKRPETVRTKAPQTAAASNDGDKKGAAEPSTGTPAITGTFGVSYPGAGTAQGEQQGPVDGDSR